MGSIDRRLEDLERRFGGGEPVRINVVREGKEEPAYSVVLMPSGEFVRVEGNPGEAERGNG
jgi:hypothetical protein